MDVMVLSERSMMTYLLPVPSPSASLRSEISESAMLSLMLYGVEVVLVGWLASHAFKPETLVKGIVIESDFVPLPAELVALTVNVNVPALVGVPEITPVVVSSVKSVCNEPESMLHVIGAVPVAASDWLYGVPTVPSVNDAVVIAGAVPAGGGDGGDGGGGGGRAGIGRVSL
jgi:hypothetical protein